VLVGMGVGPLLGRLCGRWPLRRSVLVLAILAATATTWTVVLLWPGQRRCGCWSCWSSVLGTNGPGSMIGFDFARTWNPAERQGSASGVVNVGGFVASLLTVLAVGAVLDLLTRAARPLLAGRLPRRRSPPSTCSGRSGSSACCATAGSCGAAGP
jgi:hypothetical protein